MQTMTKRQAAELLGAYRLMITCGISGVKPDAFMLGFVSALDMGIEALTKDNETTVKEDEHGTE